jgi:hypothetical protein
MSVPLDKVERTEPKFYRRNCHINVIHSAAFLMDGLGYEDDDDSSDGDAERF